ncbi:DUF4296 domain-containing protein [Pedobacter sp. Leaf132]|uniref:DUF4296 domain-containing protein n=1 Tax=Pedobacter sp. Leaf132 TaxID=2876557 RepID=UPI001E5DAE5F|nr:DUF4296 domain-containing protein [Pedobacter sp. Leaf132]
MRNLIYFVLASAFLLACKEKRPENITPPEKLQRILYDIHVVDGYISTIANSDSSKKVASAYYKGIFKRYGTDSAKHAQSMAYYYAHPTELAEVYKVISNKLERQKKVMEKADSTRKAKLGIGLEVK